MFEETEYFYGTDEIDLENHIHAFFDTPGTIHLDTEYFIDEEGCHAAKVDYKYTPSKEAQ